MDADRRYASSDGDSMSVYCDKCGEFVDDTETILFNCFLCDSCYREVEDNFNRWLQGDE